MSTNNNQKSRKSKTNYLTQILVVSLLLFVLALFANIMFHSYLWSNQLKSKQYLRIELSNDADIEAVKTALLNTSIIKEVVYISKEDGLELLKGKTNSDPTAMLDKNPLPNMYNAFVQPTATPLQIETAAANIRSIEGIVGVDFKKSDVQLLDKIIQKTAWVMLILIAILLLVAIYIIDSTVRLALFSKRMTIRSMQLIGATRGFIRKPYILRAILNGFISGIIATLFIAIIYASLEYYYPTLNLLKEVVLLSAIAGIIIFIGIVFTLISTFFSLRKYLRMKLDDLY